MASVDDLFTSCTLDEQASVFGLLNYLSKHKYERPTPKDHLINSLEQYCSNWKHFNRQTLFVKDMKYGDYFLKQNRNESNSKIALTRIFVGDMEKLKLRFIGQELSLKSLRVSLAMDCRDGPLNSEITKALIVHSGYIKQCRSSYVNEMLSWLSNGLPGDRCIMLWRWFADSRDYLLEDLVSIVAEYIGDD